MPFNGIPFYVFLGLFLLISIIHLVFCFKEMEKWRKITKPFCVIILAIAIAFASPTQYLIYIGLLFGVIGDICLIKKHKVWPFVSGVIAFFLNHICFIAEAIRLCYPVNYFLYFFLGFFPIIFCLGGYFVFKKIIREGRLTFGASVYGAFLTLDFLTMFVLAISRHSIFLAVASCGGLSFIVSDIYLCYTLFVKDKKRRDFFIMASYLLAQALIALGLVFTFIPII